MKNLAYLVSLHSVDGLGSVRLKLLLDYFEDPKKIWDAKTIELRKIHLPEKIIEKLDELRRNIDPDKYLDSITESEIQILTFYDDNYPTNLKEIPDAPIILYYKGTILDSDQKAIGVVGTRKITGYGKLVTEKFTKELVNAGFTIVSGLARGVDTTAHKTAVAEQGRTLAVLGGGLNKIFPPENTELAALIAKQYGAIISEFPPDYPSLPGNFPARNRIIAGLSKGVLVTEAAQDSGSLITARLALDYNREVFAVPGPITSNLSRGPADLIKTGAKLVFEANDILDEFGIVATSSRKQATSVNLTELEKQVLDYLDNESKHIDEVCREAKKSSAQIAATLMKMEIMGVIKNLGGGNYTKV